MNKRRTYGNDILCFPRDAMLGMMALGLVGEIIKWWMT